MTRRWHYKCENGHRLIWTQPIDTCQAAGCHAHLTAVGEGAREENARLREREGVRQSAGQR